MSEPMNGKSYLRALGYALRATPSGDDKPALQHVTFIGRSVVGADGRRWHVGYLPAGVDTCSVTRKSAQELMLALDYAHRVSKRKSGTFSVTQDDREVTIEYGARAPIVHPLEVIEVGGHPGQWIEPVPPEAPVNPEGLTRLDCGAFKDAMSWWKSWDKDYGAAQIRGGLDGGPIRIDIDASGDRAATAFLLPMAHADAEIREGLPLLDGIDKANGRSNLALDLSGDGRPDAGAQTVKIGDTELNVTGLRVPLESLLSTGPCEHRDTHDACLPCTEERVASVKRAQALEDANEAPGGKRRGKRKPAPEAEA